MKTQDRLLQFIKDHLNISITGFEKSIDAGPSTIDKYLKKDKDSFPSDELWEKITKKYPTLNKKWLQTGDGDMFGRVIKNTPPATDYNPKYIELLEKYTSSLEEKQALIKEIETLRQELANKSKK